MRRFLARLFGMLFRKEEPPRLEDYRRYCEAWYEQIFRTMLEAKSAGEKSTPLPPKKEG